MEYGSQILGTAIELDVAPTPDEDNIYHLDYPDVIEYIVNMSKHPYSLNAKSSGYKAIVIKCGASWCSPCVACAPHFKKWASEYKENDIAFCSLDVDKTDQFSHLFSAVPAWLFIDHDGKLQQEVIMGAHVPDLKPIKNKVFELRDQAN